MFNGHPRVFSQDARRVFFFALSTHELLHLMFLEQDSSIVRLLLHRCVAILAAVCSVFIHSKLSSFHY